MALPCQLLGCPLPPAVGRLGITDTPSPGQGHAASQYSGALQCHALLSRSSLSHWSLQGSAALGLLSRHSFGCCSSYTVSSPCWASAA